VKLEVGMSGRSEPGTHGEREPFGHSLAVVYVDYDKLLAEFMGHAEAANAARWAMGDLAVGLYDALHSSPELRKKFAARGLSMRSFSRAVGLATGGLDALRMTSRTFSARERHAGLTWEHHWRLAQVSLNETISARRKWLREAGKKHWTPHQLMRQLQPLAQRPETTAEARVRKLREMLALAEAQLEVRRKGSTKAR
jgi:hypothetical protein